MVKDAYYQLLQTQKNAWLAQENVAHYEDISKANRLRIKDGDISESDFLRVKMEAMKAAHSGNHGDGKIYVIDMLEGARISTGERSADLG
jgi:nitrogen regulatory protein PII